MEQINISKDEVLKRLDRYSSEKELYADKQHFDDIRCFVQYANDSNDYSIFYNKHFIVGVHDKEIYLCTPNEIVYGSSILRKKEKCIGDYIFEASEYAAKYPPLPNFSMFSQENYYYQGRKRYYLLWPRYNKYFKKEDKPMLLKFLQNCGVKYKLEIERTNVKNHPLYRQKLSSEARHTFYETNWDFYIYMLDRLLNMENFYINKCIWNCILKHDFSKYGNCCFARYAPNATSKTRIYDSSLLFFLKTKKWIPDKNGDFFKPCDIFIEDINCKFHFDDSDFKNNPILNNLKFKHKNEENLQLRKLQEEAAKLGYNLTKISK